MAQKRKKAKIEKDSVSRLSPFEAIKNAFLKAPVTSLVMLGVISGLCLNMLLAAYIWQTYILGERNRQLAEIVEQNARVGAGNAANYVHSVKVRLNLFTQSNLLAETLRQQDQVALLEFQNALQKKFPQARAIRLFTTGEAKLDAESDPPIRFSELEVIRKVERREDVIPEAFSVNNKWSVNFINAVPTDAAKPVAGTIVVTEPIEELYKYLKKGLDDKGKITLYQNFDNKPRLMGQFGEGTLFKSDPIDVPGSPWQVEFTASDSLLDETSIDYVLVGSLGLIIGLVVMSLCVMLGLMMGRRVYKKQEALQVTLQRMGRQTAASDQADEDFDFDIKPADEALLGFAEEIISADDDPLDIEDEEPAAPVKQTLEDSSVPKHIFRSYDIRGLYDKEITQALAHQIGQALGSEAQDKGETTLLVARDCRSHSPILAEKLVRGILSTGCKVLNIGTVPTPLLYYATETVSATSSGVVVTASHNPKEYNGFKVVMKGQSRSAEDVQAIRTRILEQNFRKGIGTETHMDVAPKYIESIFSDLALAGGLHVVIDAGNGAAGKIAPQLFAELGCKVTPLFCDFDGEFPNHNPDPSVADNLKHLIAKVADSGADLGIAFDGDGDRLAVVSAKGQIIWPDRLLMLLAQDILSGNPGGDVVYDVKSSSLLAQVISENGGRPIMWKTGHAPMRAKVAETEAVLGGEFSGHIFIKDRWYGFDDGLYAAARLLEIISMRNQTLDDIFAEFPSLQSTPEIRLPVPEERKFEIMEQLASKGEFSKGKVIQLDGLRVEFSFGWGLVRASNTSACLTLRFESQSKEQLEKLKLLFNRELRKIDHALHF